MHVILFPRLDDPISSCTVCAHFVRLVRPEPPDLVGSAVARFVEPAVAVIGGNEPGGETWFMVFQIAPAKATTDEVQDIADAIVRRALDLTRTDAADSWSVVYRDDDLRGVYAQAGAEEVDSWDVKDLLLGLLVELTGRPLAELAAASSRPHDPGESRRAHLLDELRTWSATYDGPVE